MGVPFTSSWEVDPSNREQVNFKQVDFVADLEGPKKQKNRVHSSLWQSPGKSRLGVMLGEEHYLECLHLASDWVLPKMSLTKGWAAN